MLLARTAVVSPMSSTLRSMGSTDSCMREEATSKISFSGRKHDLSGKRPSMNNLENRRYISANRVAYEYGRFDVSSSRHCEMCGVVAE